MFVHVGLLSYEQHNQLMHVLIYVWEDAVPCIHEVCNKKSQVLNELSERLFKTVQMNEKKNNY